MLADSLKMSISYASSLMWTCASVSRLTNDVNIERYWSGVDICLLANSQKMSILYASGLVWTCVCVSGLT